MTYDKIEYKSLNGYTGVLYGKFSMAIYDPSGAEVLHTGSRNINSLEELKKLVDKIQAFMEMFMILTNQESAEDVTGLYCDDITFCWGPCDRTRCPRNSKNIRDKRVPHSFFAEGVVPDDCPKQKEKENR